MDHNLCRGPVGYHREPGQAQLQSCIGAMDRPRHRSSTIGWQFPRERCAFIYQACRSAGCSARRERSKGSGIRSQLSYNPKWWKMNDRCSVTTTRRPFNRRQALRAMAASAVSLGLPSLAQAQDKPRPRKMILSFYCDDTSPSVAGANAFKDFLDYCAEHKIAGESTCLLGSSGHSLSRQANEQEKAFLNEAGRAWKCGIDTHMELMTHHGLFDFEANREPEGGVHEGLWLHEPMITVAQYRSEEH